MDLEVELNNAIMSSFETATHTADAFCMQEGMTHTHTHTHTHGAYWVYARLHVRRHRTHKQKHRDLSKTAASTEKAKCTTPMARFVCVRACILVRTCTLRRSLPPSLRTLGCGLII